MSSDAVSRRAVALAALAVTFTLTSVVQADPTPARPITLTQAIEGALAGNVQLVLARETITSAESTVVGSRSRRLPRLSVKANALVWDKELAVDFGGQSIVTRPQLTGSAGIVVSQPITGAIAIGKLIEVDRAQVAVDRARLDTERLDVAFQVAQVYLGGLQAATLEKIALSSVAQLDANLAQAKVLESAGTLGRVDVLRIAANRAKAQQQVIEAQTQLATARHNLGLLLGVPDGSGLALVDIDTTPPILTPTDAAAVAAAARHRPELKVAALATRQADLRIDAARAAYLPTVSAVFDFSHTIGVSTLSPNANNAYLGLSLEWDLWDWGKRKSDVDVAKSRQRQATAQQGFARDQVTVDVRTKWLAARNALSTLEVTAPGLEAAEEALRIQTVRFSQGVATTTDALDAESAVTTARAQAAIARYQYLLAWMALSRATGEVPHA